MGLGSVSQGSTSASVQQVVAWHYLSEVIPTCTPGGRPRGSAGLAKAPQSPAHRSPTQQLTTEFGLCGCWRRAEL